MLMRPQMTSGLYRWLQQVIKCGIPTLWWQYFHFTKLPATKKKARCLLESPRGSTAVVTTRGMYTFPHLRCETRLLAAHQGIFGPVQSWAPYTPLNLPWNNSLMWHAAWHKTHSHLWQWRPPLYYKDTSSERISSFHTKKKKKRQTEQGSATRGEKLKAQRAGVALPASERIDHIATEAAVYLFKRRQTV